MRTRKANRARQLVPRWRRLTAGLHHADRLSDDRGKCAVFQWSYLRMRMELKRA